MASDGRSPIIVHTEWDDSLQIGIFDPTIPNLVVDGHRKFPDDGVLDKSSRWSDTGPRASGVSLSLVSVEVDAEDFNYLPS